MLSDILQYATEVTGIKATDSEKRAQLLRWINRAGKELWDSHDLPNSLKEQVFSLGDAATDTNNVWLATFPWYVDLIRAARFPQAMDKLRVFDIRPHYHNRPWKQPLLTWRIVGETPMIRDFPADGAFLIERGTETEPFTVSLSGATSGAALTNENVTFVFGGGPELAVVGQTNASTYLTQNIWVHDAPIGMRSITKDIVTASDVNIYTADGGTLLATIPNRMMRAKNTIVQLHDESKGLFESQCELLFKTPYIPFYYDNDQFAIPQLEDAIVWKLREHWYSTKEGQSEAAILASQKCLQLVQRVCGNVEDAVEKTVRYDSEPFEFAPLKSYPYRYGRRA